MEKRTWKYTVGDGYYYFRCFKVYWAYRECVRGEIDGFTYDKRVYVGSSLRFYSEVRCKKYYMTGE